MIYGLSNWFDHLWNKVWKIMLLGLFVKRTKFLKNASKRKIKDKVLL